MLAIWANHLAGLNMSLNHVVLIEGFNCPWIKTLSDKLPLKVHYEEPSKILRCLRHSLV